MMVELKRLLRRIRCKHSEYVWLRENSSSPKGGTYPVKCCLDCGKLTWAVTIVPGRVQYLNPIKLHPEDVTAPIFVKMEDDGAIP